MAIQILNQTDLKGFTIDRNCIDSNLVTNILFKSVTYRLINKIETFMDFGCIPNMEIFPRFLRFLKQKRSEGVVIFTAAHQNMGFERLWNSFEFLRNNITDLTSSLVSAAKLRHRMFYFLDKSEGGTNARALTSERRRKARWFCTLRAAHFCDVLC